MDFRNSSPPVPISAVYSLFTPTELHLGGYPWTEIIGAATPPDYPAIKLAGASATDFFNAHVPAQALNSIFTGPELQAGGYGNSAPIAVADQLFRPTTSRVVKVLKSVLLVNDSDLDLDTLSLTAVGTALPSGATVSLVGNFVVYVAPAANAGNGSFTYTLSDGAGGHSVTGTVTVTEVTSTGSSTSAPNALQIVASGGNFVMTFIGVPGNSYRIQYTTSTSLPYAWQEFSPPAVFIAPANGVFTYTDVNPGNPVRIYRAVPHP